MRFTTYYLIKYCQWLYKLHKPTNRSSNVVTHSNFKIAFDNNVVRSICKGSTFEIIKYDVEASIIRWCHI